MENAERVELAREKAVVNNIKVADKRKKRGMEKLEIENSW